MSYTAVEALSRSNEVNMKSSKGVIESIDGLIEGACNAGKFTISTECIKNDNVESIIRKYYSDLGYKYKIESGGHGRAQHALIISWEK